LGENLLEEAALSRPSAVRSLRGPDGVSRAKMVA